MGSGAREIDMKLNSIDTLRNLRVELATAVAEGTAPDREAGTFLPLSFIERLISEIEELEERCGESDV